MIDLKKLQQAEELFLVMCDQVIDEAAMLHIEINRYTNAEPKVAFEFYRGDRQNHVLVNQEDFNFEAVLAQLIALKDERPYFNSFEYVNVPKDKLERVKKALE